MGRRNQSTSQNLTRSRKISLQNDYAFGIISPVSATNLPVPVPLTRCASDEVRIPCILVQPWQVEDKAASEYIPNDHELDIGVDPLCHAVHSSCSNKCSTSSDRFRRWSFTNFQSASKATEPSGTEVSSQFATDEDDFITRKSAINGSYVNLLVGKPGVDENWLSDFVVSIPEKVRKISAHKIPKPTSSETNIYLPDEDLKKQLQQVFVY